MVKLWTFVAVCLPFLSATVDAYANPGACSGTCVNTHDPSIIRREDGTYFRFSTGGNVATHTAPDITGPWTYQGGALVDGTSITLDGYDGDMDVWAPDVALVDGTYYLTYSAVRATSFDGVNLAKIGVATSTTLDVGSWTDLGATGVASDSTKSYNAIDSNIINANGVYYMVFGSFYDGIFEVEMANPPSTTASKASYQLSYEPEGAHPMEGASLFQYGDYYYLFYSHGTCCGYDSTVPASGDEYMIKVCRSTTAVADFYDADGVACTEGGGTIVLESHDNVYGPGGQGVYDDPTYGPVLYYHYVDTTIGYADGQKQFGWNTIDFSSGWPVV